MFLFALQYSHRKQLQDGGQHLFCCCSYVYYFKYVSYALFGISQAHKWHSTFRAKTSNTLNPCMRIWFIAPTHPHKHTQTYFLSIRTWTFRLLTRLSLLWRFWETEQNDRTESEKVTGNSNWVHWFVVVFFMTKFLFKAISHQLTEYVRRDDNAVSVQNEEGFSRVKPQTLRQTSTSLHDDTSLSRLIDLLFISVCETESLLLS